MKYIISIVLGYLLGSINGAMMVSKIKGCDIRNYGSGNAGTTNVLRVFGKKAAAFTLLVDLLKGVVAVLLVRLIWHNTTLDVLAGAAAVLGHNFPVFFKFKGGKGVLTSIATFAVIQPLATAISVICGIIVIAFTKFVSLGSLIGAVILPVATAFLCKENKPVMIFATGIALLIILRHHANIERLLNGTENKLGEKK